MKEDEKEKRIVNIFYTKSDTYRSYHVDGIYGGLTPQGNIYMEVFTEKSPIPDDEKYEVDKNEKLISPPLKKNVRQAIQRNVECGLVIDVNTAQSIINWLKDRIKIRLDFEKKEKEKK